MSNRESPFQGETDSSTIQPVLPDRPMRIEVEGSVSDDEFWALCLQNQNLRLERDSSGRLTVMGPTGGTSGLRNAELIYHLVSWKKSTGTGYVFDSNTTFALPNGARRCPDAAWVESQRYQALSQEERDGVVPLAPAFVMELLSPSDRRGDLEKKCIEYVGNGVQLCWLLDPSSQSVAVYTPDTSLRHVENPSTMTASAVVEGFQLPMDDVWASL